MLCFFKRNILARFGVPALMISDNGTRFTDQRFQDYLRNIDIKQSLTSVEHPQANNLAEAANRVILRRIRRRLETAKTKWAKELHAVLWAYRTTPTPLLVSHLFDSRTGQKQSFPLSPLNSLGEPTLTLTSQPTRLTYVKNSNLLTKSKVRQHYEK